jgi:hypothetical protein
MQAWGDYIGGALLYSSSIAIENSLYKKPIIPSRPSY